MMVRVNPKQLRGARDRSHLRTQAGLIFGVIFSVAISLLLILGSVFGETPSNAPAEKSVEVGAGGTFDVTVATQEARYGNLREEWLAKGYKPVPNVSIQIPAKAAKFGDGEFEVKASFEGRSGVLLWTSDGGWAEWTFTVPQTGLYWLGIDYYPLQGKTTPGRPIERGFMIDGKYPFNEARRLVLYRQFRDIPFEEIGRPRYYNTGDERRPKQDEIKGWQSVAFQDADATHPGPLLVYLTQGKHTLRLVGRTEPLAIAQLWVKTPQEIPTYAQVSASYAGLPVFEGKDIIFEAEETYRKALPSLRRERNSDPATHPFDPDLLLLNVFGGWRWRWGRQWVEWRFEVPEDGLYKIGIYALQNTGNQLPSYRKIEIDGKVPFKELECYEFPYSRQWRLVTLSDSKGEPYLIHLTKGVHILRMTPVMGPLEPTLRALYDVILRMASLYRRIVMVTGTDPDLNFEWELDKTLPDLVPTLNALSKELMDQAKYIEKTMGRRGSIGNSLAMVSDQLRDMARRPDTIPGRLQVLLRNQPTLSSWIRELQTGPLALDRFVVGSPNSKWTQPRVSTFQRLYVSWRHFLLSFRKDYEQVGDVYELDSEGKEKTITVWVQRGREWVEIMKELIDEDFTPKTGIRVNVNTMPTTMDVVGVIKLAAIGGHPPDAAFGVDPGFPVELAIRKAACNLNQFPGYTEVTKRFRPGALIPYHYRGGDYAIPETQDFQMLFYRKDILEELGLKVPNTWEEVYKLIPMLRRYNMWFGAGAGYEVFLYKHGGSFYNSDYTKSALDTPEALAAFVEWTDLYTKYGVPIGADLYWHFRVGDIPIITGGFGTYVMLATTAPELAGRWGMAPLPGYRLADGTIARWAGSVALAGGTRVAMIFSMSKHKEEAWELIKWWTSDTIQERYAQEVEALLGTEARWNTANLNAVKTMAWTEQELKDILEQWRWMREIPVVLGGYMTSRQLNFAWTSVVINGDNARDALESAVKEINRELIRKQEEFGILPRGAASAPSRKTGS